MAANPLARCSIIPLPDRRFSFAIHGREVTQWHFPTDVPRPFFYPVNGPFGQSLTRMGHPGAPSHDHHRSLWFGHADLFDLDFWSENTVCRIVQKQWYAIADGDDEATLAVELHWLDGHDPQSLVRQDLMASIRPGNATGEWTLELQCDFRASGEGIEFRQSNFGIIGLRVAKSLSVIFGSGTITGASGEVGEANLFGKPNRWVDYSGPIALGTDGTPQMAGLTLIDHRQNLGHPTKWHVRDDGWVGPSLSRDKAVPITNDPPLSVRFLLHVHAGLIAPRVANALADEFDQRQSMTIGKSKTPHNQWQLHRA